MSTVVLDLQNHDDEGKNCQQNDDDDRRLHWHLCKKLIAIIGPRPTFVTALHQKTAGERLRELPNFFLVFLNFRHSSGINIIKDCLEISFLAIKFLHFLGPVKLTKSFLIG